MNFSKVKQINMNRNLSEFYAYQTRLKSLPRAVFIELTQGCNLKCAMCRDNSIYVSSRLMPEALFDKIAELLFPTAELVDIRGWGESLIVSDVIKKIEIIRKYEARIRVVTNLSFKRDDVLDSLLSANAEIGISLDTVDPDLLQLLRSGTNLPLVERNLKILVNKKQNENGIYLLVTVQKPALESLVGLILFAAKCGVNEIRLFSVTAGSDSPLSLDDASAEVELNLKKAASLAKDNGIKLIASTKLGHLASNSPGQEPCIHPWAYCYVSYNGDVSCCDHLIGPGNSKYFIGNLLSDNFQNIWNGDDIVRLRKEHLTYKRKDAPQFDHCSWCYTNKYIDFEHKFIESLSTNIVKLC